MLGLEDAGRYQRTNNVEIKGVTLETDAVEIVKKLEDVIGDPVQQLEIDVCHNVPTLRPNEKNIVVRFVQ